jgi:hypothetical protein
MAMTAFDPVDLVSPFFTFAGAPNARRIEQALEVIVDVGGYDPAPLIQSARILCDLGQASEDAATWFAERMLEAYTMRLSASDPELLALSDSMADIARREGLDPEEEDFSLDDAPADWLALNRKWDARAAAACDAQLRAAGATDFADTRARNPRRWQAAFVRGAAEVLYEEGED